jgi:hypothetical protein
MKEKQRTTLDTSDLLIENALVVSYFPDSTGWANWRVQAKSFVVVVENGVLGKLIRSGGGVQTFR